jgi:hypothetical protein
LKCIFQEQVRGGPDEFSGNSGMESLATPTLNPYCSITSWKFAIVTVSRVLNLEELEEKFLKNVTISQRISKGT